MSQHLELFSLSWSQSISHCFIIICTEDQLCTSTRFIHVQSTDKQIHQVGCWEIQWFSGWLWRTLVTIAQHGVKRPLWTAASESFTRKTQEFHTALVPKEFWVGWGVVNQTAEIICRQRHVGKTNHTLRALHLCPTSCDKYRGAHALEISRNLPCTQKNIWKTWHCWKEKVKGTFFENSIQNCKLPGKEVTHARLSINNRWALTVYTAEWWRIHDCWIIHVCMTGFVITLWVKRVKTQITSCTLRCPGFSVFGLTVVSGDCWCGCGSESWMRQRAAWALSAQSTIGLWRCVSREIRAQWDWRVFWANHRGWFSFMDVSFKKKFKVFVHMCRCHQLLMFINVGLLGWKEISGTTQSKTNVGIYGFERESAGMCETPGECSSGRLCQ